MPGINDKAQIGTSDQFLEGVAVDTEAGTDLFREGVVVSDPEDAVARARVLNQDPLSDDYGQVVRVAGGVRMLGSFEPVRFRIEAAEPINAYKIITTDDEGLAILASADDISHANRILGLSFTAANTGDELEVQESGEIENAGWNWVPGTLLFVGLDGTITTNQVGVFSQAIGFARTPQKIIVRVGRAIIRS